jgi:hypothetical protein
VTKRCWISVGLAIAFAISLVSYLVGREHGARYAMLLEARIDAMLDMDLRRRALQRETDGLASALDSRINTSILEVELLTSAFSESEQAARDRLLEKLAEHRRKFHDSSRSSDPSGTAERVEKILQAN